MVTRQKKSTISSNSSASKKVALERGWWKIEFDADRLQLYNKTRYNFFIRLRKFISFVSLLFSSSTIYSFFSDSSQYFVAVFGIVMVAIFIFDIVFDLSERAAKHYDLYKRSHALLVKIELLESKDSKLLNKYKKDFKSIEVEEPQIYRALGVCCHNQVVESRGLDEKYRYKMTIAQKLFMNVYSYPHLKF